MMQEVWKRQFTSRKIYLLLTFWSFKRLFSRRLSILFLYLRHGSWNGSICNDEILPIGYDIFRTDRALEQTGGGVMTTIKHNIFIHSSQIISISTTSLEIVAVECTLPNHSKWLFICCYRPPDANNLNDFRSLCDNLLPNYEQIIIGGDLNFPNITWMESNYAGFCDILDDYFMSQLCLLPTRDFNILDLLITNLPELVSISDVRNPSILGMSSDHRIIQFKISVSLNPIVQTKRLVPILMA